MRAVFRNIVEGLFNIITIIIITIITIKIIITFKIVTGVLIVSNSVHIVMNDPSISSTIVAQNLQYISVRLNCM